MFRRAWRAVAAPQGEVQRHSTIGEHHQKDEECGSRYAPYTLEGHYSRIQNAAKRRS
ncbi:MAG TPA: hypothetical protein VNG12_08830 [Acidimicrobiales bacterium]|nr:hypothetical protein [Acidimicrobiales bacterium]